MVTYHEALLTCGLRYKEMLNEELKHSSFMPEDWQDQAKTLKPFIEEFLEGCENKMPLNKLNRWLGYIQGTLIALDITTVQAERDWTRPLFRPLDYVS